MIKLHFALNESPMVVDTAVDSLIQIDTSLRLTPLIHKTDTWS